MDPAALHAVILYGGAAVALAVTALTLIRTGDRCLPPGTIVRRMAPFFAMAALSALLLHAHGAPGADWFVTGLAALAALALSRSDRVRLHAPLALAVLAAALCLHTMSMLSGGYTMNARGLARGQVVETRWYTPLTGLRRRYDPPRRTAPAPRTPGESDAR